MAGMRLTSHNDFALRTLIFLACHRGRRVTTREVADAFDISHPHLLKVVNQLGRLGVIEVKRGKNGGISLAREPERISIGSVLRTLEDDSHLVECFDDERNQCVISPACVLKKALARALEAFYGELDGLDLGTVVSGKRATHLRKLLRP